VDNRPTATPQKMKIPVDSDYSIDGFLMRLEFRASTPGTHFPPQSSKTLLLDEGSMFVVATPGAETAGHLTARSVPP
jgi:hypothetical protein